MNVSPATFIVSCQGACSGLSLCVQLTAAAPSFEEVALRLVEAGSPVALQTFLLTKLHTLGPADKAQVRLVQHSWRWNTHQHAISYSVRIEARSSS
jgi:hypothetical protein